MYAFRDQTKPYVELVNKTASGTYTDLNQSLVEEFQQKGTEQKQNLEKLKQSLGELQAVLAPDRYQALMSRIQGSIDSTNWMLQECDNFLATPDSSFLDNIFTTMADQQENQKRLDDGLNHLETDFAVMLVGAALRGQLTVEDLEDMANKLDSSMPLQKNIERLAKHIQRRENQRQQGVEENQEDRTQERREEPPQTAVSPATPNPSRPEDLATPDLTFQEKLNKINGDNASQITMEVQQLTIEERLKQIDKRIASYEQKDKLSLKENIALSRLQSQKVQLEAYADTLEKQHAKKSEERKFNKFQQKIEQSMELLQQSQENYNQYASKMVRFFSKRYQEQLSRDIF